MSTFLCVNILFINESHFCLASIKKESFFGTMYEVKPKDMQICQYKLLPLWASF